MIRGDVAAAGLLDRHTDPGDGADVGDRLGPGQAADLADFHVGEVDHLVAQCLQQQSRAVQDLVQRQGLAQVWLQGLALAVGSAGLLQREVQAVDLARHLEGRVQGPAAVHVDDEMLTRAPSAQDGMNPLDVGLRIGTADLDGMGLIALLAEVLGLGQHLLGGSVETELTKGRRSLARPPSMR